MQCGYCGATNQEGARFCARCGRPAATSAEQIRWAPSQGALHSTDAVAEQGVAYGGFWRRFGAVIIDSLLMWIVLFMASLMGGFSAAVAGAGQGGSPAFGIGIVLFWLVGPWLYYALLESSQLQATVGKLAVGVKVTDLSGGRIGFGRASGRYWGRIVSQLIMYIGFLMAAFTAQKQALHDMMAGTLVVIRNPSPAALSSAARAKPLAGWVIALIIAACMVPVVGILAAIAIPAYQQYQERAAAAGLR